MIKRSYGGGKADGYITKIKKDGTAILFSTFWGTPQYDQTYFVQLDKDNDVYVVGQTEGIIPITPGVYNNPNSGQFITKFNDSLNTIIYSTVFGNGSGTPNISPSAFLVDYCENVYVSGWGGKIVPPITSTTGMPLTFDAIQPTTDGHNFYLFVLSPVCLNWNQAFAFPLLPRLYIMDKDCYAQIHLVYTHYKYYNDCIAFSSL